MKPASPCFREKPLGRDAGARTKTDTGGRVEHTEAIGRIGKRNGTDTLLHFISSLIKLSLNSGMVRSAPLLGGELSYIFMNYIKIDIRNNSKKELKMKVCQTHDEIFVSSFSVQHKNFVFGHLLKYTKAV